MLPQAPYSVKVNIQPAPRRGQQRFRIALVGKRKSGKSTIFAAVSSTSIEQGELTSTGKYYQVCQVAVDHDEADLVNLPYIDTLYNLNGEDRECLKYLLWGDSRPLVSRHEHQAPPTPFSRPDALIHVLDASNLASGLKFTMELIELGLPMVVALNRMDEARRKGLVIDISALSEQLGIPVLPTIAIKGQGIPELLQAVIHSAHHPICPLPLPVNDHIRTLQQQLQQTLQNIDLQSAFQMPAAFLYSQLLKGDGLLTEELASHFPATFKHYRTLIGKLEQTLPRTVTQEVLADLNHRSLSLAESIGSQVGRSHATTWEDNFDTVFLHPRWGLLGSLAVLGFILFMVFEVSTRLDLLTSAKLAALLADWQPLNPGAIILHAVADAVVGLLGIVVPYMLPLVLLLVSLEESGILHRIAFVVDRFFHQIGLHGNVAVPFLLGLGCNVPAINTVRNVARGRDRLVASLLITFVPCSARSALVLAIGGKYLGASGVISLFAINMLVVTILGRLLAHRYPQTAPGVIQPIPPYAQPQWRSVVRTTLDRSKDIVTIVLPLLLVGSVLLAGLQMAGADLWINQLLMPVTVWVLGLPVVLGVPLLFGILRKELSLLMLFQALGTSEIGNLLSWQQIMVLLIFILLYVPCISTFAVMLRTIGRREAMFSLLLSSGVALVVALALRIVLNLSQRII